MNAEYTIMEESVFIVFCDRPIQMIGVGSCDSPVFNAKYGTHTELYVNSSRILTFSLFQVGQVDYISCNGKMWLQGCTRPI